MSIFPVRRDPQHVWHPTVGWLHSVHLLAPNRFELQKLKGELGAGFIGGPPLTASSGAIYHVEIDCVTGMKGYTRSK